MGASQYEAINLRIAGHQVIQTLLDEIVCSRTIVLVVLHQRNPHRAGFSCHHHIGIKFGYLELIGMAFDGSRSSHNTHMTALGECSHALGSRPDDTKHPACSIQLRQILLLDSTQCLGRSRVTTQYDKRATLGKEMLHCLQGKLIHEFERPGAIGCTGIITQIHIIILRHQIPYLPQYSKASIARVKNSYGPFHA